VRTVNGTNFSLFVYTQFNCTVQVFVFSQFRYSVAFCSANQVVELSNYTTAFSQEFIWVKIFIEAV